MAHALRPAGRAGGVEPERAFVRRRVERRAASARGEFGGIIDMRVGRAADDEHLLQMPKFRQQAGDRFQAGGRHEKRCRAAVVENDLVIIDGEQRVQRHGNDSGLQAAPEDDWEFDRVGQDHRRAVFRPDAVARVKIDHPRAVGREPVVGQRAAALDPFEEGDGVATPFVAMTIDEIGRGISLLTLRHAFPLAAPPFSKAIVRHVKAIAPSGSR